MKLPHQPRNPSRADRKRRISQSGCQSQWPPLPWAKQPEEKGVELGDAGTSHGEAFSDQALLSPWLPKSVTGLFFRLAAQVLSACACGHLHAACVPATSHVRAHTHEYVHARLCRLINAEALGPRGLGLLLLTNTQGRWLTSSLSFLKAQRG